MPNTCKNAETNNAQGAGRVMSVERLEILVYSKHYCIIQRCIIDTGIT